MVEDDHLSHRTENFSAQKQKNYKGAQIELPVRYLERSPGQGRGAARSNTEGADPAGHKVDGEYPHSGAVNLMCPCREGVAPSAALPKNLEGRDALHAVEEIGAQGAISRAASTAAFSTKQEEERGTRQGKDGEEQEDKANRERRWTP